MICSLQVVIAVTLATTQSPGCIWTGAKSHTGNFPSGSSFRKHDL